MKLALRNNINHNEYPFLLEASHSMHVWCAHSHAIETSMKWQSLSSATERQPKVSLAIVLLVGNDYKMVGLTTFLETDKQILQRSNSFDITYTLAFLRVAEAVKATIFTVRGERNIF